MQLLLQREVWEPLRSDEEILISGMQNIIQMISRLICRWKGERETNTFCKTTVVYHLFHCLNVSSMFVSKWGFDVPHLYPTDTRTDSVQVLIDDGCQLCFKSEDVFL